MGLFLENIWINEKNKKEFPNYLELNSNKDEIYKKNLQNTDKAEHIGKFIFLVFILEKKD